MSKVKINTDKFGSLLIPSCIAADQSTLVARDSAYLVSFPNGEFDWGSVCNQINDCLEMIKKYKDWLTVIKNSYEISISNNVEAIHSVEFLEADENKITVKET